MNYSHESRRAFFYYRITSGRNYDSLEYRSRSSASIYVPGVTKFEEIEANGHLRNYFERKEDCQKYCEWKMRKDAGLFKEGEGA